MLLSAWLEGESPIQPHLLPGAELRVRGCCGGAVCSHLWPPAPVPLRAFPLRQPRVCGEEAASSPEPRRPGHATLIEFPAEPRRRPLERHQPVFIPLHEEPPQPHLESLPRALQQHICRYYVQKVSSSVQRFDTRLLTCPESEQVMR